MVGRGGAGRGDVRVCVFFWGGASSARLIKEDRPASSLGPVSMGTEHCAEVISSCVRACVHVCMCACVRVPACMRACLCVYVQASVHL